MALINCSECGNQMSDKAQNCPKCGAPNPNAPMRMPAGFTFNPCAWHSDMPAVSSCVTCGRAMCKNCVDTAPFTVDNKPQCNECSLQMLSENIAANKKTKTWSIIKLTFLLFFMFIGLGLFMTDPNYAMNAWICAGIGGLPSALKTFMTRSAEEKLVDEAMSRVDPNEGCFQQIVFFFVRIIFAFVFAPVAAIWFTIKNIIAITKCSRAIKADQEDYDTILSRMQEMESIDGEQNSFTEQEAPTISPITTNKPTQPETPIQQTKPNQAPTNTEAHTSQTMQAIQTPPSSVPNQKQTPPKANNKMLVGIIIGAVVLVGLISGYFVWYAPYAKDRDALRTYVVANNVFLRSSKMAGVEYNVLTKVPYGSELITYTKDSEWAEVKVNGIEGYAASPYLLEWSNFTLLNGVWGSADVKEYIESSKCRLAILDYCKRNQLNTGNDGWQLYTLQKDVKPNMVLFPRLNNGYDKFTEFAFILKNNATQERKLAIYSFEEETEKPIFLYEENAPTEGKIKNIKFNNARNEYQVSYTGNSPVPTKENKPAIRTEEKPVLSSVSTEVKPTTASTNPVAKTEVVSETESTIPATTEDTGDNNIYTTVEEAPEYPNGGVAGVSKFISNNLRYPEYCKKNNIQGRVVVSFVINKDGSTSDYQVIKSVDPYLDKEALRVLSLMSKWKPGKQRGVPVRVKFTIPINFKL